MRGEPVRLKPRVFNTLLYLAAHPGRVLEKDELMNAIWPDAIVEENSLNQNISTLRRIFGETRGENRYIVTIPGRGYQFVAGVRTTTDFDQSKPFTLSPELPIAPATSLSPARRSKFPLLFTLAIVAAIAVVPAVWWRMQPAMTPVRTIAVLPFKPITRDSADESLEVGMADTLIAKLSNLHEVVVRPLSAVRKYGAIEQDPLLAGRALGVDAVLDGQIQKSGNRIRLTTRLLRVKDAKQLWTEQFDEELTDIFALQDSVSEKVADSLSLRLNGKERELVVKRYTSNAEAYELYLKGRLFLTRMTFDSIVKATAFLKEAIRKDPQYALAYAELADSYQRLPVSSDIPAQEAFPKARAAALKALEIDGQLVEARTVLGWINLWHDWNWHGAEREFEAAIRMNPNYGFAHLGLAHLASDLGRKEEAIREADRALSIDPVSVHAGMIKGFALYQARRYRQSIDSLRKTSELEPNYWVTHLFTGKSYERLGRYDEAESEFLKARDLSGGSSEPASMLAFNHARSGRKQMAEKILQQLKTSSASKYVPPYNIAIVYLGLGAETEALEYLERAYKERDVHMVFLGSDPKWDSLRNNRGFVSLSKRMGFTLSE